ncbi:rab11 family-interacting protein 4A [Scyliorhinus canicula]|uniref:rab11 family-interacting protein 4A n=1 Tax=Scyliorhinus canicula TaxID=7830 RepID=UPI0018F3D6BF|nr:rab11 family-interacting protein 4A [Scyliorhinus canicula]
MDVDGEQCQEESLAQFVRKLREVFDAVAGDTGGFLRVENFIHLGLQFMEGEEMQKVTKYLDPRNLGRISFQEFCHGIFAIKGCDDLLDNALCLENAPMVHYAPQFEDYYCRQSAPVTDSGFLDCESAESEGEIYTDDDTMTLSQQAIPQESDMDSAIENAQSSEVPELGREDGKGSQMVSLFLPRTEQAGSPSFSEPSSSSLLSAEEQYEDYGEADESDFIPSSPCPDDESRTNGFSDLGSSVSSSAGQTPRKMRHVFSSEFLDVYCSQCSKKMNLLNDLEARLKKLKANSPNRKISSTAFGRQLFHNSNISSSNGSTEDLFRDSIDSCDNDITEKVRLSGEVSLKQSKPRAAINLTSREVPNNNENSDLLFFTVSVILSRLPVLTVSVSALQLIEDLRKELEYLQIFQLDSERGVWSRNPASNAIELSFRSKEMELEYEAKRLKQENLRLKEQNDDLNGQILSLSLYEAKNLFATQTKAQSLAAEIDTATRDQLMEALQEQEEINLRLRQYMDKIILAILDHNPSILEIKK